MWEEKKKNLEETTQTWGGHLKLHTDSNLNSGLNWDPFQFYLANTLVAWLSCDMLPHKAKLFWKAGHYAGDNIIPL